jgi:nucleoside-diphosphate-sugar epimerase
VLAGFGYCAEFLAKNLALQSHKIYAISRQVPTVLPEHITHVQLDIAKESVDINEDYILYYFIPPISKDANDTTLEFFLNHLKTKPKKIIYIGSSGIYGNHDGNIVDEMSPCHMTSLRQMQRKSAEEILTQYSTLHHIPLALLRVAGIYGSNRLPIDAAKLETAIIFPEQAPLINHIYIKDLANILCLLGTSITYHGIVNIADGTPHPMGYLQQTCARVLKLKPAPYIDFQDALLTASPMKKEFMTQNKQLSIRTLKQILNNTQTSITLLEVGIKECLNG